MIFDSFSSDPDTLTAPPSDVEAVSPSDSADLAHVTKALNAATSGSVRVTTEGGTVTDVFLAAGIVFPLRVRRIWSTGTTATGLRGLF